MCIAVCSSILPPTSTIHLLSTSIVARSSWALLRPIAKAMKKIRKRAISAFRRRSRTLGEDPSFQWFGVSVYDHLSESLYIEAWDPSDEDDSRNGDTSSVSTYSTNATADDLPGPGRLLDKYVYQRGGRLLERFVMKWTMASLHPIHIVRYLSLSPTSWVLGLGETFEEATLRIETSFGPTLIAGLKSLVQQTQ